MLPGLATTNGRLIVISTGYAKAGIMWEAKTRYRGRPGPCMFIQAASLEMNGTLSKTLVEQGFINDPEGAKAEWGGEGRSDVSCLFDEETIRGLTISGRHELPPLPGIKHRAFCDPSGGRQVA